MYIMDVAVYMGARGFSLPKNNDSEEVVLQEDTS